MPSTTQVVKSLPDSYECNMRLKLNTALAENRLEDFIVQAEGDAFGLADRAQFDALLGAVTAPLQEGQTSHSPAHGLKRGT